MRLVSPVCGMIYSLTLPTVLVSATFITINKNKKNPEIKKCNVKKIGQLFDFLFELPVL